MIRTLQKKFILTAMVAVSVLLVLMLGLFNGMNLITTHRENLRLMEILGRNEPMREHGPEEQLPALPGADQPGHFRPNDENTRMSAVYFTARQTAEGWQTDISRIADVTEEQAAKLAQKWLDSGKLTGTEGNFRYRIQKDPFGGLQCIGLDLRTQRYNALRVLLLSLAAGAVCWLAMLLLVILLSKKAIDPLAQNMEKQRRFVTDAGHELKTPLAIIQANTEAMELHTGENKWSRNIRSQVERLNRLTQSLLILARADEGQPTLKGETVAFSDLLTEQLVVFEAPAAAKELTFRGSLAPGLTCKGDVGQLATMLSTLLDNAVQYAPAGTVISVTLSSEERGLVLQLQNQCDPLPACPPEKLFDRFYRGDAARTQQKGGCGVGLSVAKAIADAHGGSLTARYQEDSILFEFKIS